MIIYIDHNNKAQYSTYVFRQGDDLCLELVFLDAENNVYLPDWDEVLMGAKKKGDYNGDFLAYAEFYPYKGTGGTLCYYANVRLDSAELARLIGNNDAVTLIGEFKFRRVGCAVSTQTLNLRVENNVIKGTEGKPQGTIPEYATVKYVDKVVTEGIREQIGDSVQEAAASAEAATQKAVEAETSAGASRTSQAQAQAAADRAEEAAKAASELLIDIPRLSITPPEGARYTYDAQSNIFTVSMDNINAYLRIFEIPRGLSVVTLRLTDVRDGDFLTVYIVKPSGVQLRLLPAEGMEPLSLLQGPEILQSGEYLFTFTKIRDTLRAVSLFVLARNIE